MSHGPAREGGGAVVLPFPGDRRQARRLVSLVELMDLYGYSERWWRYRLKDGLPKHPWGGRLRFDPSEVEAWMEERYGA
jgi:predicted DNA-binding transcriptional regulator AlpA